MKSVGMTVWVVASLFTSACWPNKEKPRSFRPLPIAAKVPVSVPPPEFPAPPELQEVSSLDQPRLEGSLPQFAPPPAARATSSPKPSSAKPTASQQPAVAEAPPAAEPIQLGQVFTPAQIGEYTHVLDEILPRVKGMLNTFAGKNLNKDDQLTVDSIRNFVTLAEQKQRDKDLAAAVSLAKRADSLAKDLSAHVR